MFAPDPINILVNIGVHDITVVLDTGASYFVFCERDWKKLSSPKLEPSSISLGTYDGNYLQVRGS